MNFGTVISPEALIELFLHEKEISEMTRFLAHNQEESNGTRSGKRDYIISKLSQEKPTSMPSLLRW